MFTKDIKPKGRSCNIVFIYECFSFEIKNRLKFFSHHVFKQPSKS